MQLEDIVTSLVREVVPKRNAKAPLTLDSQLRAELGIDSFALMTLAFRIEERFGVDLAEHSEAVAQVKTVRELCAALRAVGAEAK